MGEAIPIVSIVAAVAENGVIGRKGDLPWRIPSEMRHFRRLTLGKPVIMGRTTFASLKKPLGGRDNIILTRQPGVQA
ncbi:MAG: dihydrofolate reductase, partial [Rhodomicrobiaceae bacterium]